MSTTTEPLQAPRSRWRSVVSFLLLRHDYWERSLLHRVRRVLMFLAYVYVGILVILLLLEDRFLYPASTAEDWWVEAPPTLNYEDVEFISTDGTRLHAWWCPPEGWTPEQGAMLYNHGNGGNLSSRGDLLLHWQTKMNTAVLIYDYPGYGKSEGKPSEAGLYASADAAYDWLTKEKGVKPENLLLYGGSLGGGVALDLANRRPCRALILVAAFTSFPDMAHKTFPWLPARWLVRNQFDNLDKIDKIEVPVFLAHGTADRLVPFAHGERIYAKANEPKQFFAMLGRGHNNGATPEFYEELTKFLNEYACHEEP